MYFFNVKPLCRDKGACITRAAAYRAGERIRDERTGRVHDYSDRDDVVHKEIFLQTAFEANPALDWARDRSTLWNAVEHSNRRNALLGREVFAVLPYEATAEQRTHLVRRYSQDFADRYGCAVDATIHPPRPWDDPRFHHAHILFTSQQVTPEGLGPRISLSLSGQERYRAGLCSRKEDFMWIREHWAEVKNELLKEWGFESRIGARTLGLDEEPMPRIPHKILCMERKTGVPSQIGEDIRRCYAERVEARRQGPEALARVLTKQKEEGHKKALERALQKAAAPRKRAWAALTKKELAQRALDYYRRNKDRINERRREAYRRNPEPIKQKQREAYQRNPELMRQKRREARARERAELSPEQQSVQRKGREQQKVLAQTPEDSGKRRLEWREQHKEELAQTPKDAAQRPLEWREQQKELALTPEDSAKRGQAYREAEKEKANARPVLEKTDSRRTVRKSAHHKELDHSLDYEYDYDFGL